ncbi:acetate--CoA ligase family protein [Paraburkholderia caballeronis]|uniref:Acyl-CoA synthetase (NDP forming) n=1 Tax=Paraburkholderia caballeronis TaxID=416943 RepID=A0A1H7JAP3_9BURK|nr:acetate--CoA ligase family protein [Paraburkholderia caballeronis]PXW27500.1 acyl-CoA synthetase (NDP forming) [Paraburkholderia caballeronis]PXX02974.1 acyl-CoA synthetase (NDP forming) [Paraburkholderia caballeronis]RAK03699.1 acyl-CoA synthetase (NDP forming) [Paraburkholderia caballeronis]SEC25054.1 Acyl-CoA synthetase (NDP forming) [Paraburkholderia caballeronis]SEK71688.1 Acyl-CoA synthetase (NDP forming) [Paraburkholderia caballeronis]
MKNPNPVQTLLCPRSIAIVGASSSVKKVSGRILSTMARGRYSGRIFPVNPRAEELFGLRCYPSLDAIGEPVEHCVIALPADQVPQVLADCRRLGVRSATIIAAGYAELGEEGSRLQAELVDAAGEMTFLGPNSMGFANLVDGLFATSVPTLEHQSDSGDVAIVSQSGGLAYSASWFMAQAGIDLSYLVMSGNAAGVSFADLLEFFFDDAKTRVVVMLIESDAIVAQLVEVVERRGLVKPVVLLKVGRGETGVAMAKSHTGSLAGDYRVARDCAQHAGLVFVDDLDEAVGCTSLLRRGITAANGDDIAALSVSGGNVVLFSDQVDLSGMRFAPLAETTQRRLREVLPEFIAVQNPVDLTTQGYVDPTLQDHTIRILSDDPSVTTIVPIITAAADYRATCQSLAALTPAIGRPLVLLWTGGSYDAESPGILAQAGIPVFRSANLLVRCFRAMRAASVDEAPLRRPARTANAGSNAVTLSEGDSMAFLQRNGVPVARFAAVQSDGVAQAAASLGYPVVLKQDVSETHISDSGGVVLDIRNADELADAAERLRREGASLILSQFRPGLELIASVFVHPVFGPLLMTGSGGIWTEALGDVQFVPLPASAAAFARALKRTTIGAILHEGRRGASGFDAAVALLDRLARCFIDNDDVVQIEMNPVTVSRGEARAVDASVTRVAGTAGREER